MDNQNTPATPETPTPQTTTPPPPTGTPAPTPPAAPQPQTSPATAPAAPNPNSHTMLVILLLIFVYPIGVIVMWVMMKHWPMWLKVLISLPVVLGIVGFLSMFFIPTTGQIPTS